MSTRLSKNEISSFAGDVVPLYLVSDEETRFADIKWSVEGDTCHIRGFSGSARGAFNDGVIVTLDKVGTGKVTAEYKGERYTATVTAREMKRYTGGELNYYVGDLQFENGLPKTTKQDDKYHGFGLKSIKYVTEKYGGSYTLTVDDGVFELNVVMFPFKR